MNNDNINSTKDTIISVANRLFGRFGFHKTSMDEIAKIARKAKGSLYYHFSSKEDLFREVISKEMDNMKSQLTIIINNPNMGASEKLKNYLIKRMDIMNNAANYHETIKADFFERFSFIDDLRNEIDEWEKKNIQQILLQGINGGEFSVNAETNILSEITIMIIKGLEVPFFVQNEYDKFSMHFDGLINILIKGLSK